VRGPQTRKLSQLGKSTAETFAEGTRREGSGRRPLAVAPLCSSPAGRSWLAGWLAGFSRNSRAPRRAPHEAAAGSLVILMTNASWAFAALLLCARPSQPAPRDPAKHLAC